MDVNEYRIKGKSENWIIFGCEYVSHCLWNISDYESNKN